MQLKEPIAILGFGTEGQYALEFLKSQKIDIATVCDHNVDLTLPKGVKGKLGDTAFDDLSSFQTVIRSPGVKLSEQGIQDFIELGRTVTSMTQLTLEEASDRMTVITGTNGKTTTTALTEQILRAHYGDKLVVGGNDRSPVLMEVLKHPKKPVLMEASSFQYADVTHSPYIAAVLNITPNHLDWHADLEEYALAKSNVLRHQKNSDWALLNANNENVAKLSTMTNAQHFWIGDARGDHYALWKDEHLVLCFEGTNEVVCHRDQLNVKTHPDNVLFTVAIAKLHFVPTSTVVEQLKAFHGVEHRLEYVRTVKDVHFYNDSSSTSPDSTLVAINQFVPDRLIVMLGGSSKNADFDYLADTLVKKHVRVVLYGAEGQTIKERLLAHGGESLILEHFKAGDFEGIVHRTFELAKPEDSVVLSPACASFDMFKNAKDRGEQFKRVIKEL